MCPDLTVNEKVVPYFIQILLPPCCFIYMDNIYRFCRVEAGTLSAVLDHVYSSFVARVLARKA